MPILRERTFATAQHRSIACALALAGLVVSSAASAQSSDAERTAAAQALFDRALELEAQGHFDQACPKLEEVVRLEPTGLGAKLRLAECYEKVGRITSAWTSYVLAEHAATAANQAERAAFAHTHAEALKPHLPRLAVVVSPGLRKLPGLVVQRDGLAVGEPQWDTPVPADPGKHTLTVTATGKTPWSITVELAADTPPKTVSVPDLADAGAAPVAPAATAATAATAGAQNPNASSTPPDDAAQPQGVPTWAWAAGAGGIVLAGAAVAFLVDERSIQGTIHDRCDETRCDRSDGFDPEAANSRLYRDFDLFLVLGGAGVLALGVSVYGIASAGPSKPAAARAPRTSHGIVSAIDAAPWISPSTAGARLGGTF